MYFVHFRDSEFASVSPLMDSLVMCSLPAYARLNLVHPPHAVQATCNKINIHRQTTTKQNEKVKKNVFF